MAGLLAVGQADFVLAAPALDLIALRAELDALKADQARTNQRIAVLEGALSAVTVSPSLSSSTTAPTAPASALPAAQTPNIIQVAASRVALSGDFRVRYESNFGDRDARNRDRGVLRARLRGTYAPNTWLTIGAELDTGDPDDPNSTDTTLSGFDDDLDVSLSQAFVRGTFGRLQIQAGKFQLPFTRTDLVWDGDVNPEGLSAAYAATLSPSLKLRASALYFLVDELAVGPDSRMIGGQIGGEATLSQALKIELAGSYYDYALKSLVGADAGDIRTNRFANGRYVSDYNLLDIIGAMTWSGLGSRWPVRLTGDYVRNFGADAGNTGFGADLTVGRIAQQRDWRFGYGYAEVGVDAVLAAFSHDNTAIATNYLQHSLSVDYVPRPNLILNATFYHYRPKAALFAGSNQPGDWLDRVRLNFLVNF